jgi:hypothetical protein
MTKNQEWVKAIEKEGNLFTLGKIYFEMWGKFVI